MKSNATATPDGLDADDSIVWVYNPQPSLGIPDGLTVEFLQRQPFGYRVSNMDDIEELLEGVKERMIAHRAIGYSTE